MQNLKPLVLFCTAFLSMAAGAGHAQLNISYNTQVAGFTNPVDIAAEPGSNRIFVVQQGGLIRIADGNSILPTPFLDVSALLPQSGSETGLLSMAFHPDYTSNRYFFIYYNDVNGSITLARYRRMADNPDIADAGSGTVLLTIPKSGTNHNGGKLNFGPDGFLYVGTGDGGGSNDPDQNGQNPASLLGKMLRIDVSSFATAAPFYNIPAGNPFAGDDGIRDEIFAMGLRNPWRWSFDRLTGDMWIADVGEAAKEEVNYRAAGSTGGVNYGWRCYEGSELTNGISGCSPAAGTLVNPVFEYTHDAGRSVTGGFVYRGSQYPALRGYYICADYITGNLWVVQPSGAATMQAGLPRFIASFGEGNDGELYAVSRSTGTLFQLDLGTTLPLRLLSFAGVPQAQGNLITWNTAAEEGITSFVVEYSRNGRDFQPAGTIAAQNTSGEHNYRYLHRQALSELVYYRLQMLFADGSMQYSSVISLNSKAGQTIRVFPTSLYTGQPLQVIMGVPVGRIQVLDASGQQVFAQETNGATGYIQLALPSLRPGLYYIRFSNKEHTFSEKIIIR